MSMFAILPSKNTASSICPSAELFPGILIEDVAAERPGRQRPLDPLQPAHVDEHVFPPGHVGDAGLHASPMLTTVIGTPFTKIVAVSRSWFTFTAPEENELTGAEPAREYPPHELVPSAMRMLHAAATPPPPHDQLRFAPFPPPNA